MSGLFALSVLLSLAQPEEVSLGQPVTVEYNIPDSLTPLPLEEGESYSILSQTGDSVTLVPLVLDTLELPAMHALDPDSSVLTFSVAPLTVARTMPDTTWNVSVFTSPVGMHIPPGFPSDYLKRHMFWLKWGRAPSRTWLMILIAGLVIALASLGYWLHRRRRAGGLTGETASGSVRRSDPVDEVRALLETAAFARGDWQEYYREIDKLLRNTVALRFDICNRALTWGQIGRRLSSESAGKRFHKDSRELMREITLQRYAGWGGSRDRARKFTEKLVTIRKEWHRK